MQTKTQNHTAINDEARRQTGQRQAPLQTYTGERVSRSSKSVKPPIYVSRTIDKAGLSVRQFAVLSHLAMRQADAYRSIDIIAARCRMHHTTVVAAVRELEARRLVVCERARGAVTRYRIAEPSLLFVDFRLGFIGLNPYELRLLGHLECQSFHSGVARLGLRSIAGTCRMRRAIVSKSVQGLVGRGYLTVTVGKTHSTGTNGEPNRYVISWQKLAFELKGYRANREHANRANREHILATVMAPVSYTAKAVVANAPQDSGHAATAVSHTQGKHGTATTAPRPPSSSALAETARERDIRDGYNRARKTEGVEHLWHSADFLTPNMRKAIALYREEPWALSMTFKKAMNGREGVKLPKKRSLTALLFANITRAKRPKRAPVSDAHPCKTTVRPNVIGAIREATQAVTMQRR
jgi:DNA-binding MarR family transcriptional regulator